MDRFSAVMSLLFAAIAVGFALEARQQAPPEEVVYYSFPTSHEDVQPDGVPMGEIRLDPCKTCGSTEHIYQQHPR